MNERVDNLEPVPCRDENLLRLGHPISMGLGLYLLLLGAVLFYGLLLVWPNVTAKDGSAPLKDFLGIKPTREVLLILLAMIMGGLGTLLHVAGSFVMFVGNRELGRSWAFWYLLYPCIGMMLAVVLFFVLAAGFLTINNGGEVINPHGVAALSALAGMFAKPATEKLREVFETIFSVRKPNQSKDKLGSTIPKALPVIESVQPPEIRKGVDKSIRIMGRNFVLGSKLVINGQEREAQFNSDHELASTLAEADWTGNGKLSIAVFNPPPGGGESNAHTVKVVPT